MKTTAAYLVVTLLLALGGGAFALLLGLGWWRHRQVSRRARQRIGHYT